MKNSISLLITLFMVSFVSAQIPAGYYSSASGLTGYALKSQLKVIVTNGHTDNGYGGLWEAYKVGDLDKYYENDNTILDIYSEKPAGPDAYNYTPGTNQCGNYSGEGQCYNREHVFPQGFFNEGAPMKNDYLHVFPTDGSVNGRRSNYPFGRVGSASWTSTNGSKLGTSNFPGYGGTVFEPIDEFKGDIARSLLYFITRYEDGLQQFDYNDANNPQDGSRDRGFEQWYINLLLLWHQNDPVSVKETARNDYAYVYQKNRNPYIDHPEYVTMIWTSTLSTNDIAINKNALKISQNPVRNGELTVSGENMEKIATAQIISVSGQVVQTISEPFKKSNSIILKNTTKGVYMLKTADQTLKFIVE
ncbi:MAG: endonuclease [Kaistella sp.]